jgi:protein-S-isoprenylcysteine O-methyltransferase Ste14
VLALFVLAAVTMAWSLQSLPSRDVLGVKPILRGLQGGAPPRTRLSIRGPYRWVRHPIYTAALVMFWAHPDLTADRLLFNGLGTVWVVAATWLEERDLVAAFGDEYRAYQARVPMLVPRWTPRDPAEGTHSAVQQEVAP